MGTQAAETDRYSQLILSWRKKSISVSVCVCVKCREEKRKGEKTKKARDRKERSVLIVSRQHGEKKAWPVALLHISLRDKNNDMMLEKGLLCVLPMR